MYIKKVEIENIRNISNFVWELNNNDSLAGWHVIIGDNGSGKSSVLRAIALTLIGKENAGGARQIWNEWLTRGTDKGKIVLELLDDVNLDKYKERGRTGTPKLRAGLEFIRENGTVTLEVAKVESKPAPSRHVWGGGKGWFSTAYGPFRRFTGGNKDFEKLFYSNLRLASHLSVFGEDVALSEAIEWLKELHIKRLEHLPEGELLEPIIRFVNQDDFLPHNANLKDISSQGVKFVDANGHEIGVENLSDGYRSILSMTFEIIRQLKIAYPDEEIFSQDETEIILPGVVLIDEVDAHLHPTWQYRVGTWFTKHFPKMQFIVTTHSPLVCQSAVNGSIWRLPAPGSGEDSYRVETSSEEWKRLVYGNILEAYSTDLFGENIDRSEIAQEKLERVSELSMKQMDAPLKSEEKKELEKLMDELPATSTTYTFRLGVNDD